MTDDDESMSLDRVAREYTAPADRHPVPAMSMQDLPRGQHVTVAAPTGGWLVDVLAIWDGPFYDTGHPEYQVAPISEFGLHEIRGRRIAASQLWVYRAAGQSKHTSQIPEHDDLKWLARAGEDGTTPPIMRFRSAADLPSLSVARVLYFHDSRWLVAVALTEPHDSPGGFVVDVIEQPGYWAMVHGGPLPTNASVTTLPLHHLWIS